jgi:hypothetical protein
MLARGFTVFSTIILGAGLLWLCVCGLNPLSMLGVALFGTDCIINPSDDFSGALVSFVTILRSQV